MDFFRMLSYLKRDYNYKLLEAYESRIDVFLNKFLDTIQTSYDENLTIEIEEEHKNKLNIIKDFLENQQVKEEERHNFIIIKDNTFNVDMKISKHKNNLLDLETKVNELKAYLLDEMNKYNSKLNHIKEFINYKIDYDIRKISQHKKTLRLSKLINMPSRSFDNLYFNDLNINIDKNSIIGNIAFNFI
jgi:hypothetical protein